MRSFAAALVVLAFTACARPSASAPPPRAPVPVSAPAPLAVFVDGRVTVGPPNLVRPPRLPGLVDGLAADLVAAGYRVVRNKNEPHAFAIHLILKGACASVTPLHHDSPEQDCVAMPDPAMVMLRLKRHGLPFDAVSTGLTFPDRQHARAIRAMFPQLVTRIAASAGVKQLAAGGGSSDQPPPADVTTTSASAPAPVTSPGPVAAHPAALVKPASVLVMPLRALGDVRPDRSEVVGNLLLARLDGVNGLSTYCQADLEVMLAVEKQKDVVGCDDSSCMAQLGGALGADYVLYGSLGRLDQSYQLSLTVVRASANAVAARLAKSLPAQDAAVEGRVGEAVAELVERLNR